MMIIVQVEIYKADNDYSISGMVLANQKEYNGIMSKLLGVESLDEKTETEVINKINTMRALRKIELTVMDGR